MTDDSDDRRSWRFYGVVLGLLVLVVTALPVAALNTATVSVHSTASEFSSGTLDDATVEGSGENASVVFDPYDESSPSVTASVNSSQKLRGAYGIELTESSHAVVTGTAEDSLAVLDTSSSSPSITGYVNDSAAMSSPYDVVLGSNDDYAYVTGTGSDSLAVVDVSSRSSPSVAGFVNSSSSMDNPHGLAKSGDYVYVPGYASDSVAVVDVSNPGSPSVVGSVSDGSALDGAFDIEVVGEYAFVSTLAGDTVTVLDVSSPASPTVVTTVSDSALDGATALDHRGDRLVVTSAASETLAVLNISDRASPTVVGSVSSPQLADPGDVQIVRGYAFVAGENRLTSVDISSASSPSVVGSVTESSAMGGAHGLAATDQHVFVAAGASDSVTRVGFDGGGQAQYVSAAHSVSKAANGFTDLALTGATATVEWQGNGSSWTTLATKTVGASGNHSISFDGSGYDEVRTTVTVSGTLGTSATLSKEGVNFENHAPKFDSENATPQGEESVSGTNMTMEIPVTDSDFGTAQGEQVEVEFYVDGQFEGTKTLTSNGTATMTVTNLSSGKHSWHVEAADKWGGTASSKSFGSAVGITLSVHDGDNVSQLIDDQTVTAELIATDSNSNFKETRTTSDGVFRFDGVPNEQLAVRLDSDGYQTRRIVIDHPYKQPDRNTILLNTNQSSTFEQCFKLDSKGAGYPPSNSWLTLESYLDGKWRDVGGTYFGSTNLACVGVTDDHEYRLVVSDGTHTRDLGGYTADKSFRDSVIPLTITDINVGLGSSGKPYSLDASGSVNQTTGEGSINVTFESNDQSIQDLHLTIHERGNEDDPVFEKTVFGTVETYSASVPIPANKTDRTYVLEWDAAKNESQISGRQYVSVGRSTVNLGLSGKWKRIVGAGLVLFVGALFGPLSASIGAVVTGAFSAGLWYIGWLDVRAGVIIYAVSIGVAFYVAERAGGR